MLYQITGEGRKMCGRLSQYRGIHDFVDTLSMPGVWRNNIGDQALERYNVAPSTQVAVLRMDDAGPRADLVRWGWRPHWATDRAAPINARVEKVAHGPFFRAIWPHRAITPIDGWYEWVDEGGPKKQPYYIRRRDGLPALCASIGQFTGASMTASSSSPPTPRAAWLTCTIGGQSCWLQGQPGRGSIQPSSQSTPNRWP
ncbi:hypothetical protein WP4W18C03_12690 [Pseudomonas putida]|nr:hypothetical protein WP4W18C03_12690 [Pseudomonas putida]